MPRPRREVQVLACGLVTCPDCLWFPFGGCRTPRTVTTSTRRCMWRDTVHLIVMRIGEPSEGTSRYRQPGSAAYKTPFQVSLADLADFELKVRFNLIKFPIIVPRIYADLRRNFNYNYLPYDHVCMHMLCIRCVYAHKRLFTEVHSIFHVCTCVSVRFVELMYLVVVTVL